MLDSFDPNLIQDIEGARQAVLKLLNLIEELKQGNDELRRENQRLRDEVQRLKGEQGKPDIKPNRPKQRGGGKTDHSSEKERR